MCSTGSKPSPILYEALQSGVMDSWLQVGVRHPASPDWFSCREGSGFSERFVKDRSRCTRGCKCVWIFGPRFDTPAGPIPFNSHHGRERLRSTED